MLAPMLPPSRISSLRRVPGRRYRKYSGASGDVVENKGTASHIRRCSRAPRSKSVLPPAGMANAPVTGYPGKVLKIKDRLRLESDRGGHCGHRGGRGNLPLRALAANAPITGYPGNTLKTKDALRMVGKKCAVPIADSEGFILTCGS